MNHERERERQQLVELRAQVKVALDVAVARVDALLEWLAERDEMGGES